MDYVCVLCGGWCIGECVVCCVGWVVCDVDCVFDCDCWVGVVECEGVDEVCYGWYCVKVVGNIRIVVWW